MDLFEKLEILSAAAKYDVSCSSSGSKRKNKAGGIGNASYGGICHSFTSDGRCISLLKILLTNKCIFNCAYCINRSSNDVKRAAFTPQEVADLTINFYKRNYIEGLFLSSAVFVNSNYTMELLVKTLKLLRYNYNFNGYIHVKAIPGADELLIEEAGRLADRMSVNIELPSSNGLKMLAPQKSKDKILKPMSFIGTQILQSVEEKKKYRHSSNFVPAGQSTQLIVGATDDSDYKIMNLSQSLYDKMNLKRVYYSAYVPINHGDKLPEVKNPPLLREHRLYEADWLLRFYGFRADELLNESNPFLNLNYDPKTDWAIRNLHLFPVEINTAPYHMLLKVPGIGVKSANRIYASRKVHSLSMDDLKKLGIVLKRAQYFITCSGKYRGSVPFDEKYIKMSLSPKFDLNIASEAKTESYEQLSFFNTLPVLKSSITGEL